MSASITDTLAHRKSGNLFRLTMGLIVGAFVTAALFWTMQYLIETADRELNEGTSGSLVDFVRLKRDESIQRRQLKPKKPPPPDAPPPQPPTPQLDNLNPNAEKIAISAAPVETELAAGELHGARGLEAPLKSGGTLTDSFSIPGTEAQSVVLQICPQEKLSASDRCRLTEWGK